MCRRLKRATGRCGRSPTRVPRGWRRGWEKSRLPAAIRTPSPASDTRSEVRGARTVDEFFAGLRTGHGRIHGAHGSCGKLTADVFSIVRSLLWDKPWTLAMSPLALLVPAFTAGHWLNEIRFCRTWSAAIERGEKRKRMLWDLDSKYEANWAS